MNYEKPEITVALTAVSAIKGSKNCGTQDNPDSNPVKTCAAYEADE